MARSIPRLAHSCSGKSVFDKTDDTGTRKRSDDLRPTTTAGRTLRLVRSVKGIGKRTTSFLEQVIENVVGVISPDLRQRLLGKFQPGFTFCVGVDGHAYMRVVRYRQRMLKQQFTVFVY